MKHFSELSTMAAKVVDVAESLIQHSGYNGFSYDDVARQVGIKKPSIHHHFATKADLVAVVAQRYTHRFRAQLLHLEGQHAQPRDRLLAYAALFEKTFEQDRKLCVCGMLGAEVEGLPEDVTREVQNFFTVNLEWLTGVIAAGLANNTLRHSMSARSQAELFLCALEGAMVVGRGAPPGIGPSLVGKALVSLVLA